VGLIAAAIAAIYPMLITADGALMSESLYGLLIALCLLAGYRLLDAPNGGRAIALGALLGLAALARGEALLSVPLILWPILRRPRGGRVALMACCTTVLVIAPWTVRNWGGVP
jgi:4-amino-4-deoxy-L-arabinose transferase-like glycosyltransferase